MPEGDNISHMRCMIRNAHEEFTLIESRLHAGAADTRQRKDENLQEQQHCREDSKKRDILANVAPVFADFCLPLQLGFELFEGRKTVILIRHQEAPLY